MAIIVKVVGMLTALVSTLVLLAGTLRGGLLVFATILGVVKIVVMLAFLGLTVGVLYLLVTSPSGGDTTAR
ncbi:MAG: hypothetical protein ACKV2V_02290 [Blastocatellia bacterium]